ncbi:MAG TPA: DNA mismatch repair endonuclease MutL [Planctomycetota bacterium]|nr:DNA mismatch repair endonuclease MutL [Planctomycetota bacterium]
MNSEIAARIVALPELVVNQIAAGEVIERPASAVKELIENSLDAGARQITIDLGLGGVSLIRVVDDGIGMGAADLELAFASHATSKLREVADLEHIATLGFRGEALASIGSVARVRLLSRARGAPLGAEIHNEGGRISTLREAGSPEGTTVELRDLFFNTPARRRFLKTTATELGRCLDVIQRLALANSGVGFVATHEGRRLYDVEAGMNLRERVRRSFGTELAEALVAVEARDGTMRLSGFVAPPRLSRNDTARQMWFLNGRPLRDKLLSRILKDAYRGFLVEGRQPVAFLALSVDPAAVDVNVHPAKAEVRFRDERRLFGFLVNHLRDAVRSTDMSTPGETMLRRVEERSAWALQSSESLTPALRWAASENPPLGARELPIVREVAPTRMATPAQDEALPASALPLIQIAKTYIVRALEDGFEILDQHALHERITFEGLKRDLERGAIETQRFLVPEIVDVSRAQVALAEEHAAELARLGLLVAAFGATSVAVHGVPARLRRVDPAGLVRDVLELIEERGAAPTSEKILEEVLHRAACRASVMAGDSLSEAEMRALLALGSGIESDQTCVHARPTRVRFTLADLEKAFHRR